LNCAGDAAVEEVDGNRLPGVKELFLPSPRDSRIRPPPDTFPPVLAESGRLLFGVLEDGGGG